MACVGEYVHIEQIETKKYPLKKVGLAASKAREWIVDSGTTPHMTHTKKGLRNFGARSTLETTLPPKSKV